VSFLRTGIKYREEHRKTGRTVRTMDVAGAQYGTHGLYTACTVPGRPTVHTREVPGRLLYIPERYPGGIYPPGGTREAYTHPVQYPGVITSPSTVPRCYNLTQEVPGRHKPHPGSTREA